MSRIIASLDQGIRNNYQLTVDTLAIVREWLLQRDAWELSDEGTWEEISPVGVFAEWTLDGDPDWQHELDQVEQDWITRAGETGLLVEFDGEAGMVWFIDTTDNV